MTEFTPVIPGDRRLPEITLRVVALSILLTIVLAMSNAYLALKIGILVSASIPAAIVSMAVLRFARNANLLENNLVQTAASAGEAIAGGIVYTTPALILIHFWERFNYWENVAIALVGGMLGVLFSIPLRRVLVTDQRLAFPEGRAIAEVLIAGHAKKIEFSDIFKGGLVGAVVELLQTGFHVVSQDIYGWVNWGKVIGGFEWGCSAPMLGVGYLIGLRVGLSLFVGALVGWLFGIPFMSWDNQQLVGLDPHSAVQILYDQKLRYVGVGAMLTAGIMTLSGIAKPFIRSMYSTWQAFQLSHTALRTERDLPFPYWMVAMISVGIGVLGLLYWQLPIVDLHLNYTWNGTFVIGCVVYIFIVGFICCAITGYFSGLVGVTATPGSAMIIAGLLLAALMLRWMLSASGVSEIGDSKLAAAATTIFLGAIITGAAAIANDNMQDLKVGHLLGATPWKQQLMLGLGVVVAALIIPMVMQLLFSVYGIGDVLPHAGMDPTKTLPVPPATMMAAITQGVFNYNLPWHLLGGGAVIIVGALGLNVTLLNRSPLSLLGVAMGIYLPLATSTPLFCGGLVAFLAQRHWHKHHIKGALESQQHRYRRATLVACGLISGAAVMNIVLAVPFIFLQSADAMAIMPTSLQSIANYLGLIVGGLICVWLYRSATS